MTYGFKDFLLRKKLRKTLAIPLWKNSNREMPARFRQLGHEPTLSGI
jgi:hypothetical protein